MLTIEVGMQLYLLDRGAPSFDPSVAAKRRWLDRWSWVDVARGWLRGSQALFAQLQSHVDWQAHRRRMYERYVDVPRLSGACPDPSSVPIVGKLAVALGRHYGIDLSSIALAMYRDGNDSVAWHSDKILRDAREATVALVILGQPRPFMLRPKEGGPSITLRPGWGDLLVMGGECQRRWDHSVPKVAHTGPRIALMFRNFDDIEPLGRRKTVNSAEVALR